MVRSCGLSPLRCSDPAVSVASKPSPLASIYRSYFGLSRRLALIKSYSALGTLHHCTASVLSTAELGADAAHRSRRCSLSLWRSLQLTQSELVACSVPGSSLSRFSHCACCSQRRAIMAQTRTLLALSVRARIPYESTIGNNAPWRSPSFLLF